MNTQSGLFQEISIEIIRDIFVHALHEEIIWEAVLLDGGLFNTTYLVEYGSFHKKAVLRLGVYLFRMQNDWGSLLESPYM